MQKSPLIRQYTKEISLLLLSVISSLNVYAQSLNADFEITSNTCLGSTVIFHQIDTISEGSVLWEWDFGVNAIPQKAFSPGPHWVNYTIDGAKTASLTISNGTNTNTSTLNFNVEPVTGVLTITPFGTQESVDPTIGITPGDPTIFEVNRALGTGSTITLNMGDFFGDNGIFVNPAGNLATYTYTIPGTYIISVRETLGDCFLDAYLTVYVNDTGFGTPPTDPEIDPTNNEALFTISPTGGACFGSEVSIFDMSQGIQVKEDATRAYCFYINPLSEGEELQPSAAITYTADSLSGTYIFTEMTGSVDDGTARVYTETYDVGVYPNAAFEIMGDFCGTDNTFTATAKRVKGWNYEWKYFNNDAQTVVKNASTVDITLLSDTDTVPVQLTVTNKMGCQSIAVQNLFKCMNDTTVVAGIIIDPGFAGCTNIISNVRSYSTGTINTYNWNFGETTAGTHQVAIPTGQETTISLQINYGSDTTQSQVISLTVDN